ncbi:MAG TPA: type II toxin-antitoxin system Phd/YefM family antitoxin [Candidatus Sulfotelmatobacter sp.]|jgi:prevent-host-death family protein|nr:type II toxin-antitoxin system Phd/YefM family antitoxin [Candidatus Sulfotelmatobacter sp.]
MEVNIHQAKTHFSRLIQRVAAGEEIIIARAGVPVARLVAIEPATKVRPLGMDRGRIWIADDFDAPLPDDLLKAFYGGEPLPVEATKNVQSVGRRKGRRKTS